MRSQTLRKLIRAIAARSNDDLDRIAFQIVRDEKRVGHTRLAEELDGLLKSETAVRREGSDDPAETSQDIGSLAELPRSRRHRDPLATIIPRDQLEHHMVLPPEVESRFERIEKEYAARHRLAKHGMVPR
ncbi:MAG: ATP-binding protein, partial [Planctomycetota bacterium]